METNANKAPEQKTEELLEALKLISGIVAGPELKSIKDFVRMTDEARQVEQAALEQKIESSLAQIREDAMAISADLRHTKEGIEADRKKWREEIAAVTGQVEKASEDLSHQIANTEKTLLSDATKLQVQIEATQSQREQKSNQRFQAVEDRVSQCENESTARRAENSRLAKSMRIAAQSLVAGATEDTSNADNFGEQVDTILSALNDKEKDKEKIDIEAVLNETE